VLRWLPAALTIGAVLWAATLFAAPFALTSRNQRVVAGAATVYNGAAFICHQRAARSFHVGGIQLPVCGRCTGLYLSGAIGALVGWVRSRRPRVPSNTRRVVLVAALPTVVSLALEWFGIIDPTNVGRALCALPFGAATGWIFVQSLRAEAREERTPNPGVRIAIR
jgi:uncharacterized membrane protein